MFVFDICDSVRAKINHKAPSFELTITRGIFNKIFETFLIDIDSILSHSSLFLTGLDFVLNKDECDPVFTVSRSPSLPIEGAVV